MNQKKNANTRSGQTRRRPPLPDGKRPERRTEQEPVKSTPDVVYMPPKPFNRNRLILRLATIAAVVIAVMLCLSVFFKVQRIEISGMNKYSAWDIEQASGIQTGDNLLSFGKARASGKIMSSLRYVKSVRIGIKLPDTVKIEVVEVEVTYPIQDSTGKWWLMSSEGKVVDQVTGDSAAGTKITGVKLLNPVLGQMASAWQEEQPGTDEEGNVIPVTVTAAERLSAALEIATALEFNGIIGKAESVNVENLSDIRMQYDKKFQVILGTKTELPLKIRCLKSAVSQFISTEGGILDITDPNKIQFREK